MRPGADAKPNAVRSCCIGLVPASILMAVPEGFLKGAMLWCIRKDGIYLLRGFRDDTGALF